MLACFLVKRDLTEAHLQTEVAKKLPVAAAAFVEEHAYRGPLYNHYNWGGYLMWRLPQYPVGMDGRTIVHGAERIQRAEETWQGQPGWDQDPEFTGAGLVIAQTRSPLVSLLRRERRFRPVYADDVATVYVQDLPGEK